MTTGPVAAGVDALPIEGVEVSMAVVVDPPVCEVESVSDGWPRWDAC